MMMTIVTNQKIRFLDTQKCFIYNNLDKQLEMNNTILNMKGRAWKHY